MTDLDKLREEWNPATMGDWSHTPPFEVMRNLIAKEPSLFWKLDIGHIQNTLEEALDRLEKAEAERDEWKRLFSECHPIHLDGVWRAERAEAAVERVRAEAESVILEDRDPHNDWNMALDYLAKRVLAALDSKEGE